MKFLILYSFFQMMGLGTNANASLTSEWLVPNLEKRLYETTQERTRPIMAGDIIYFANNSGTISAVHRLFGYSFWQKKLSAGVEGALGYGRSKLVVGDLKGNLYGLNARDGSESWHFKISAEWVSAPLIHRDKVFVASSNDELYALSDTHGKEIWHYSHRGDEKMTIRGASGPVVFGNEVYLGFSDGHLVALQAENGKVIWDKQLKTKTRFYDVDMQVYVDESIVVAATFDGKVYGLDRTNGETKWVLPVGSYGGFYSEDNYIYFSSLEGHFYCVDKVTGAIVWKTPFKGGVGTTPAKAGDRLILTSAGDPVSVFDFKTGKFIESFDLGAGTLAPPVGSPDGWFYILSGYGNLFSYQVKNIKEKLKAPETVRLPSAIYRDFGRLNKNSNPS